MTTDDTPGAEPTPIDALVPFCEQIALSLRPVLDRTLTSSERSQRAGALLMEAHALIRRVHAAYPDRPEIGDLMDRLRYALEDLMNVARAYHDSSNEDKQLMLGAAIAAVLEIGAALCARRLIRPTAVATDTETSHSPDFTTVDWFGTRYVFAKGNQAESVRVLWEAWEAGEHAVSGETIAESIGNEAARFELRKVFRTRRPGGRYKPHPAWGTMIQRDGRGLYRLTAP